MAGSAAQAQAMRRGPRISLKARALKLLAQREHSRSELRRKLLPHAEAACLAASAAAAPLADADESAPVGGDTADAAGCLDRLLDWLEAHRYLSQERFVEARVHARSGRFGNLRIRQELQQHGTPLDAGTAAELKATELERARRVWARKFGDAADAVVRPDAAERARQARFLASRGFTPETIRRVLRDENGH